MTASYAPAKQSGEVMTSIPMVDCVMEEEKPQPSQDPLLALREQHWAHRAHFIFWGIKFAVLLILVGVPLAVPVILFRNDRDLEDEESIEQRQYRQLIFYLFLWLLITWLGGCVSYLLACALPYVFRFITRYLNPAWHRYWRVLRVMNRPIVLIGLLASCYASFDILINTNELLAVNFAIDPSVERWDDVIDLILEQCTLWTAFYLVEKVAILYITIHYHYRSDLEKITHSKDMLNSLMTLYEASIYLYPVGCNEFRTEDAILRNSRGIGHVEPRTRVTSYLSRMGVDSYGMTSFFGNFLSSDPSSHWLKPASTYSVVERALGNAQSASALAKRIWMSLVPSGHDALTADDIKEVLGPFRQEEAAACFKIIDENESGDIRLDEMIWTVVETGRIRHAIFQSMSDIDHCINTLDWVAIFLLAAVMVFFILVIYVPTIKEIQNTAAFLVIGLSFAVGRTFNHFLTGVVFVLFDHPFDVGDRVEVYNMASNLSTSLIVKRQSLLYTVFRRVDNGSDMQIANERLIQKRIENVTRSGVNRQAISMLIDFKTSFTDLMYLRKELEAFLTHPDNKRDYMPDLALSIVNVNDLVKMELRCSFAHKSNWSNEKLRAARSMKFMCALVAALRRVPIQRPGGEPPFLGDEGKPYYYVEISAEDAATQKKSTAAKKAAARIDASKSEEKKSDSAVHAAVTGEQAMSAEDAAKAKKEKDAAAAAAAKHAEIVAQGALVKVPASGAGRPNDLATSSGIDVAQLAGDVRGLREKSNSGIESMFHR